MTVEERQTFITEYLNMLADITISKNLKLHKVTLSKKIKSLKNKIKYFKRLQIMCDGYIGVCNHYSNLQKLIIVNK